VTGMHIEKNGKWLLLELSGDIDLAWRDVHREEIQTALTDCPPRVIINLEQVSFMDSTGLSLIVEAYRHCIDGEVLILNPRHFVMRTLGVSGLDRIVTVVSDCDEVREIYAQLTESDPRDRGLAI
jgi:anti-sigma B factor antagonist